MVGIQKLLAFITSTCILTLKTKIIIIIGFPNIKNDRSEMSIWFKRVVLSRCATDEWSCLNDQCIPMTAKCDKVQDCPQGEDELICDNEDRKST